MMGFRWIAYNVVLVLTLGVFLCTPALAEKDTKRTALVIGNSNYENITSLKNPVNDATDIKIALEKIGFEVILKTDADRRGLRQAVRSFNNKIRKGGVGLFYYAGHGIQVDGVNYMIPVGADITHQFDIEEEGLKMNYVLGAMEEANNKLNIVILDACRDNPFRSFRSSAKGLARMDAPRGSIIAYATSPGEKAADGEGRNGTYTANLLKHLTNPKLSVKDVLNQTGLDVMAATDDEQTPWMSSTPIREFFLAGGTPDIPPPNLIEPSKGSLNISSTPSGAQIFVNGEYKGNAPLIVKALSDDEYTVIGKLEGHEPCEKKILVNEGLETVLALSLDKIRTRGTLYVTTNPEGSKVDILNTLEEYRDGIKLNSGRYQVQVSKRGYKTKTQWVSIKGGGGVSLLVDLEKKGLPKKTLASKKQDSGNDVWKETITGMDFVWVPKGCFQMGSNYGHVDEKPVHEACVDGFWIGKYEVTQGQWNTIMSGNPSKFKSGDNYPVEMVSMKEVKEFVRKISQFSGKNFSLPTEAQWEYAAKSGGKNEKYSGNNNNIDPVAWYSDNSDSKTHQVGKKAPNSFGIYDMTGNVWEWCEDIYEKNAYSKHAKNNPVSTSDGSKRVLRGGSWYDLPKFCRTARRAGYDSANRNSFIGFRLVMLSDQ